MIVRPFLGRRELLKQQGFRDPFSSKIFFGRVSRLRYSAVVLFFFFFRIFVLVCLPAIYWVTRLFLLYFFPLSNLFARQLNSKHHSSRLQRWQFSASLLCTTCCRPIFFFLYSTVYMDNVWRRAMPFDLQVKPWCYGVLRCSSVSRQGGWQTDWNIFFIPVLLEMNQSGELCDANKNKTKKWWNLARWTFFL